MQQQVFGCAILPAVLDSRLCKIPFAPSATRVGRSHAPANPSTPSEVDFHYAQGTAYVTAGEPGCAYYLYHSPVRKGPYTYHSGPFFTDTAITVPIPTTGYTMIRAAKTITTGSATYLNLSQGVF